jgi:hypothetical protein
MKTKYLFALLLLLWVCILPMGRRVQKKEPLIFLPIPWLIPIQTIHQRAEDCGKNR